MNFFRPQHEHFLGLIGVHEFFSFNFLLREYFFLYFAPPPPPPPPKRSPFSLAAGDMGAGLIANVFQD